MNAQTASLPAQAEPSDFFPELLPPRPRRRRTGDIARLPMPVQDSINRMLDEGVPYAEIIKRLGADGQGLTKQKLSRWRYGAHQDYLRKQDLATRTRLLTEYAAELIVQPGSNPDQVARVCREVAAGQMLTTLLDHGRDALGSALKSDPSTVFRLFNTICNVSESCLAAEKARHLFAALPLQPSGEVGRVVPPAPPPGEGTGPTGSKRSSAESFVGPVVGPVPSPGGVFQLPPEATLTQGGCAPPVGQNVSPSPEQSRPVLDKKYCNERAPLSTRFNPKNSVAASPSQSHLVPDKKINTPAPPPHRTRRSPSPQPSPRGEGETTPPHRDPNRPLLRNAGLGSPSPRGEGWGEGDRDVRQPIEVHGEGDRRVRKSLHVDSMAEYV